MKKKVNMQIWYMGLLQYLNEKGFADFRGNKFNGKWFSRFICLHCSAHAQRNHSNWYFILGDLLMWLIFYVHNYI